MIRLIQRRLIIPRGDTGSFSIPTLGSVTEGDVAIFGIFDPLTHKAVLMKKFNATVPTLTIVFESEDTINIEPRKYTWDITIYKSPIYDEENMLIGAAEINSYYAAYKLPICEIRDVALDENNSRRQTRDLLLNVDGYNENQELPMVYPWENLQLSVLSQQLSKLGFSGGELSGEDGQQSDDNYSIVFGTLQTFPTPGNEDTLYFDTESGILYYFKQATATYEQISALPRIP